MRTRNTLAVLGLWLAVRVLPSAMADEAGANANENAGRILRQMSSEIGGAQRFTFEAHRQIDAGLIAGRHVPEDAHVAIAVLRPNKVTAKVTSKDDVRQFYADGLNLSLVDVTKNQYASVAMFGSIDTMVAGVERRYGFTPPLAQFTLSSIYQDIRRKTQKISYLGQSVDSGSYFSGGVACHRLELSGKVVDTELWVGVNDLLPKRLISTFKDRAGKPQIKVEFSNWNLRSRVTEADFVFLRPRGAQRIPMKATGEVKAAK